MTDVNGQINDVRREVGTRVLEAGEARVVTISQSYDTTVDDLWDACTNPERIPRWFLPVSGELRVGGRYKLEGNASGTVESCDPPHRFTATWEFGDETTWVELRVSEDPAGGARFELDHIAHVDDEKWAQFGPGAVGIGWDLAVVGLAGHFGALEKAITPAEGAAWVGSDEGRAFMRASNEAWRDAHVAAGAPAEAAREAADRTATAYGAA